MKRIVTNAALVVLGIWASAALAQDAASPKTETLPIDSGAPHRFQFSKSGDGVLRLDNETGQVSYCNARDNGWVCQLAADDRTALDAEITRLNGQIDSLKTQLATLGASSPPPRPPEGVPPSKSGELKLPSRADLDRAKSFFDDAWRRLVDMIEQWRHDLRRS